MYTQQWYMSYRFVDSFRVVPGFIIKKFVMMHGHMSVKFARSISNPTPNKKKGMGRSGFMWLRSGTISGLL